MGVSIDGIGEVNNLIRFPSKWWKIEENFKKFTQAEGRFDLHITSTIQILNIWQLPEFIEYLLTNNYSRVGPWEETPVMTPHPVHRPAYLNVNILEDSFKQKLIQRFKEYKQKWNSTDWQKEYGDSNNATWEQKINHAKKILDRFETFMYSTKYEEQELIKWRSNSLHYLDKLDEIRGTDWKKTCPELYESMKVWYDLPKGLY
jgi:sulfatase maturation enzyme AslB (radical SAM superfamily)